MPYRGGTQRAAFRATSAPMYDNAVAAKVAEYAMLVGVAEPVAYIEERCGRYTRGAHAGYLKGWATFEVCREGGWSRRFSAFGGVVRPGTLAGITVTDFHGRELLRLSL